MREYRFEAALERPNMPGAWTFLRIPFSVPVEFGRRGRVPVKGSVNGAAFRSSLLPQGAGAHILVVNRQLRQQAGVTVGDVVQVEFSADDELRQVELPDELAAALSEREGAVAAFARLSYSHRREYAEHVGGAKRPETRVRRAATAVDLLLQAEAMGLSPRYRRSRS